MYLSNGLSGQILWTTYENRDAKDKKKSKIDLLFLVSCRDVNCSGHGLCIEGKCRCFHGYTADDCSILIQSQCDQRCSGHGQYIDYPQSMCICEKDWSGTDCSQRRCSLDCGSHGKCSNASQPICQCDDGWSGKTCTTKLCPKFCQECNSDGQCICSNGYTGRYCQISKIDQSNWTLLINVL